MGKFENTAVRLGMASKESGRMLRTLKIICESFKLVLKSLTEFIFLNFRLLRRNLNTDFQRNIAPVGQIWGEQIGRSFSSLSCSILISRDIGQF